jgi:hypothetical protein
MSRARVLLPGLFAAACTSAAPPPAAPIPAAAPPAATPPAVQPDPVDPPPPAALERPRTHLLVERFAPKSPTALVLPLTVGDTSIEPLSQSTVERPAMTHPSWPGHYTTVAAHAGGATWIAGEPDGAGHRLVARTIGDPSAKATALPLIPSALHHVGDVAVIGAGNLVGHVDLTQPTPTWTETHRRADMKFKAYDLLVRSGTWLIAIDDVVTPIYADSFRIDPSGIPAHTAAWELPGAINGRYTLGALSRSADRDGVLYVVVPYGIMDGNGQDLAALPIRADALAHGSDVVLNSARSADPPVLEEHVSRQTGKPEKLAAGREFTPWRGLALHRGRVLLAAGARGLLVVPGTFGPDTGATAVGVGGDCRDVIVDGDRTFVLVGGRSDAVVELAWDGPAARELRRVALPGAFDRFLH